MEVTSQSTLFELPYCTSSPSGFWLTPGVTKAIKAIALGCIVRRMPRMQVYLPDDLYRELKKRKLPASELLQEAVRAELRRQGLLAETDRYLAELVAEVGEPTDDQVARAEAVARRIRERRVKRAS